MLLQHLPTSCYTCNGFIITLLNNEYIKIKTMIIGINILIQTLELLIQFFY